MITALLSEAPGAVKPIPFQGYRFRVLSRTHDGLAAIAYPVGFRPSGVMKFVACAIPLTRPLIPAQPLSVSDPRDYPAEYECARADDPSIELIRGGSAIVSPFADVLAGPVYGQEALLCADIDLSDRIRSEYELDVVGHYAWPDVGVQV